LKVCARAGRRSSMGGENRRGSGSRLEERLVQLPPAPLRFRPPPGTRRGCLPCENLWGSRSALDDRRVRPV
jgi:hypothetical protein